MEDYQLIDPNEDIFSQVRMESTLYTRTMNSGYSELMGLHPPSSSNRDNLTDAQIVALQPGQIAAPPFNITNSSEIQDKLGNTALPHGFQGIPIYNYMNKPLADDLDLDGCGYVLDVDNRRWPNETTYDPVDYLIDELNHPIAVAFGLNLTNSTNMTFMSDSW